MMNASLVLLVIAILCSAVALVVGLSMFLSLCRPWRVRCPRDGVDARVQVDALGAARGELIGRSCLSVVRCSHRAPTEVCDEACLHAPPAERRPVRSDDPPVPVLGTPTILVPLDGTRGSEAALPTARTLARAQGGRVRLLRVMPTAQSVRDLDHRIVAYSDQESARDEYAAEWYLRGVARALDGLEVEEVVRFGDPAAEIVRAAKEPDVTAIAMATRPLTRWRRLFRRSVTRAVERAAWVPVRRAEYGASSM
jgi:nucleotide-binding universal stress UspA family protein